MRVNIWIRKDNESKWDAIADKSNWVNTLLENSADTSTYGEVRAGPVGPMVTVLAEVVEVEPCKHGYDPRMCKFAKPGKPCK